MNQNHPTVPCIVMTGYGNPELEAAQRHLGIYAFLEKPVTLEILISTIHGALDHIDQNEHTTGVSVAGFLELINVEHKSCVLMTSHPKEGNGKFFFIDGELYSAQCGEIQGDEAVIKMLCWENATHSIVNLPSELIDPDVTCGLESLIRKAEALTINIPVAEKVKPVSNDLVAAMDCDMLNKAIRLAEGDNAKHAQPILAKYLKKTPRNAEGWLWFSRVSTNMNTINVALKNASSLDPESAKIKKEVAKIELALKDGCNKDSTVKRCPFCWMPKVGTIIVCKYCKAQLTLSEKIPGTPPKPNRSLLKKAALRFRRIVRAERDNHLAHFYYGLAHFNLGNCGKAVNQLYKTKVLCPTNEFYRLQLKSLLDYMASIESLHNEQSASAKLKDTKGTILIVDDSGVIRKVLRTILVQEGFQIIEAKNGIDALARLNEEIPALILLDIIMPEMDGYEVLAAIRKSSAYKEIPIIMLTAKDSLISKVKGRIAGCNDYLTKPFKHQILITKVSEYIN